MCLRASCKTYTPEVMFLDNGKITTTGLTTALGKEVY